MTWIITPKQKIDPDAAAYLSRVEAADTQALEPALRIAIEQFIVGCKADGIWNAIKASCILAGARTLNGALVPLAGVAPTNNGPFVQSDYDRKIGLLGNGSTKYLNSNRSNIADPQDSKHMAVFLGSSLTSSTAGRAHMGVVASGFAQTGASLIFTDPSTLGTNDSGRYRANGATPAVVAGGLAAGFRGASRSSSTDISVRQGGNTSSISSTSESPINANLFVFARNATLADPTSPVDNVSNARLAFYSIGESLNLAQLDSRVTTLINAIAAAIP